MAWNAQRNTIYARRCQNFAVAMQNLVEEAARLREIFVQQLQADPAEFEDTDIATKTEITTFQSYLTEFMVFHNGSGTEQSPLSAVVDRGVAWALPLVDTTPA